MKSTLRTTADMLPATEREQERESEKEKERERKEESERAIRLRQFKNSHGTQPLKGDTKSPDCSCLQDVVVGLSVACEMP